MWYYINNIFIDILFILHKDLHLFTCHIQPNAYACNTKI